MSVIKWEIQDLIRSGCGNIEDVESQDDSFDDDSILSEESFTDNDSDTAEHSDRRGYADRRGKSKKRQGRGSDSPKRTRERRLREASSLSDRSGSEDDHGYRDSLDGTMIVDPPRTNLSKSPISDRPSSRNWAVRRGSWAGWEIRGASIVVERWH